MDNNYNSYNQSGQQQNVSNQPIVQPQYDAYTQQYGYSYQPVDNQYSYSGQPVQQQYDPYTQQQYSYQPVAQPQYVSSQPVQPYGYVQQYNTSYVVVQQPRPEPQPAKGLAIVGMIFGILSLVGCYFTWFFCGVPGFICSLVAKKRGNTGGPAKAGFVMSIISIAIFGTIALIGMIGAFSSAVS